MLLEPIMEEGKLKYERIVSNPYLFLQLAMLTRLSSVIVTMNGAVQIKRPPKSGRMDICILQNPSASIT